MLALPRSLSPAQFIRCFSTNEPLLIGGPELGRCFIFRRPLKQSTGLFNYSASVSGHPNQLCGGGTEVNLYKKSTSVPLSKQTVAAVVKRRLALFKSIVEGIFKTLSLKMSNGAPLRGRLRPYHIRLTVKKM
ncbi:Uncharacterised protein [Streptococcus criceti]|nr:Uncharacterised protein [Streptococcus criceti]